MQASTTPASLFIALLAFGASSPFIAINQVQASPVRALVFDDPTAEQVMAASVKAMGGREAIFKIKNMRAVMTMNSQGTDIQMESCWARDGGRMSRTVMPQGEMHMVSDGKVAWTKTAAGYALLDETQTQNLDQQASIFMNTLDPQGRVKASIASIENAGKREFAGKECWSLRYTRKDGKTGDIFYDVETSMPMGFESVEKQGDKEITSRGMPSDWQEADGVKIFRSLKLETSALAGAAMTLTVKSIEINTLDPAVFAMPEEVKKLADARPAATAPAGTPAKEITFESLNEEQQKIAKQALDGMLKSGDVEKMKLMVKQLEPMLGMIPEKDRLPMQYAVQEVKKEIAKKGG